MGKLFHRLAPLVGLALFVGAVVVLWRESRHLRLADIRAAVASLPHWRIAVAAGFIALCYAALTLYDVLAFRYIDHPLPYRRVGLASFAGFAFGFNVGFSALSGGAVRYRLYGAWGLTGGEVARVIGFTTITSAMGIAGMAGIAFTIEPATLAPIAGWSSVLLRVLGAVFLGGIAGYLAWTTLWRRPIRWKGGEVRPPRAALALAHLGVSVAEWSLAGLAMYCLMPAGAEPPFFLFLGAFVLAGAASLISSVPGGLGVFETVLLLLLKAYAPEAAVLAALLLYRVLFYLLPFALAAMLLTIFELEERWKGNDLGAGGASQERGRSSGSSCG